MRVPCTPNVPGNAIDAAIAQNWNLIAIGILLVLIEFASWIRAHTDKTKKGN